jgi:Tol biopolymer transport system component
MRPFKLIIIILITLAFGCEKDEYDFSQFDSKVLFISRRLENSSEWNLMSMNYDGTEQTKITELTVRCERPIISHSGKKILFVHYTDNSFYELYAINIDGTNLTLIDSANRYCGNANWSFDDSKIIYSKNRSELIDENDLILYDFTTNEKCTLTTTGNNHSAKFSLNNKIVYSNQDNYQSCDIYVMNIDGTSKLLIISNACNPLYSPDGSKIAYISVGEQGSPQIFTANVDGTDSKQLTETYLPNWDSGFPTYGNYDPHWTPDGKMIVYVSEINEGTPEIYIMSSDGSNQKRLTNTERRNESPELTFDGKFILFSSNRISNMNSEIFVMNINGKNQKPLTNYYGSDIYPLEIHE